MIITGIFAFFVFRITNLTILIPYIFLLGVTFGLALAVLPTIAPDTALSPSSIGMAIGICVLGQYFASGLAPVFVESVVQDSGYNWNKVTPFLLGAGIFGIVFSIIFLINEKENSIPDTSGRGARKLRIAS